MFSEQALRIKTKFAARNGAVANITYAVGIIPVLIQALFLSILKGNTAINMRQFGVLIDQVRFHEYITGCAEIDLVFI